MRKLLENDNRYYIPKIIKELCTERIFTSEYIEGVLYIFILKKFIYLNLKFFIVNIY